MNKLKRAAIAALAAFSVAAPALLLAPAALAQPLPVGDWPQAHSDLRADPNIRFGALPNGMRYAIMRNVTPPGQVSMRLRFHVGSLMERDDQQGLAHFLEHMAFNGSTNVPSRYEMIQDLQRLGLAFGADTNAGTEFDQTTYQFNLPKSDEATVDTSLMLLREIGGNLTLSQAAMDQERGVILSEERLRDTPSYRVTKALLGLDLEGQRPPERFPIGLVPVIQSANRDLIADIYRKYYRPERATLIIVGDIDPAAIEAKIKAKFSDWQGQGAAGEDPDLGPVKTRPTAYRLAIEPGSQASVQLAWVTAPDLSPDTVQRERRDLIERLGFAVLNRRLETLARSATPPFISAGAGRGDLLRAEQISRVIVNVQPGQWKPGMDAAETEIRRLVQFGVRPDELAREIAEEDAALKAAVAGAATRQTPALADEIVGTLGDDSVETSPTDDLALFEEITKDLTPDTVDAALKAAFTGDGPLVFVASPDPVDGGESAVKTAFEADEAAPVTPPEAARQVVWPYTSFGPAGKVVDTKDITDLDAVQVRFENGVRLIVKPTKFADDQILVRVRFGSGLEGFAPDHQPATWAGQAFIDGGLGKISAEDRDRALTGVIYRNDFGVDDDSFVLGGATRQADFATQLQVLTAYVADPGWRPEALQRWKTIYATAEDQFDSTDTNVLSRDASGLLHGSDRRWTFPRRDDVAAVTPDALKAALTPALTSGPIEVTVVGDITVDKAIDAVGQTFGALPRRADPAPPAPPPNDPRFPAPITTPLVETHKGRADQGVAVIAWPTNDFYASPQAARTNVILDDVLKLRLTDTIREKEGVSYSPTAQAQTSLVFPRFGYILAYMEAPPAKLDGFYTDVSAIAADLRTKPVGDDELTRAKQPEIEALEKARATNSYWLAGLSGAAADPRRFDLLRSAQAQLERVSAADVQQAAQTYLRDDTAWRWEIEPANPAPAPPAPPAAPPPAPPPAAH